MSSNSLRALCLKNNGQWMSMYNDTHAIFALGMLVQLVASVMIVAGLAPCVLQRACPARRPRPPSTVCMHRIPSTRAERIVSCDRKCSKGSAKRKRIAV